MDEQHSRGQCPQEVRLRRTDPSPLRCHQSGKSSSELSKYLFSNKLFFKLINIEEVRNPCLIFSFQDQCLLKILD